MRMLRLLLVAAAMLGPMPAAWAAELLMFRQDGCPYCARWDRDVGGAYGKTDAGRRAPVRMLDIERDQSRYSLNSRVLYTPTFVLMEGGREVGRIEGYPGPDFFWGLLERLIERLPSPATDGLSSRSRQEP